MIAFYDTKQTKKMKLNQVKKLNLSLVITLFSKDRILKNVVHIIEQYNYH